MPRKPAATPLSIKPELALGSLIDTLYRSRARRLDLEKDVEELKRQEGDLQAQVIQALTKVKLNSGRGKAANATIVMKRSYRVPGERWIEFWTWARKDKTGVYVQKRLAVEAIGEQVRAGKHVPGVEPFDSVGLSVTKVGAKP